MKATGIVRRIDDLGRVVIPMELRRSLGINDRDSLEIYTDNEGKIILKKYDPLPEIFNRVKKWLMAIRIMSRKLQKKP